MSANSRILFRLLGVILFMGAAAWAAVPFYSWFCRTTGYGGTTNVAEAGSDEVLDQTIEVRFDANVARGMPWKFRPVQNTMTLRIGETGLAFFEAENTSDRVVAGTAAYNVAPDTAGYYFDKIQCFCFTEQVLQPHEKVEMPVSFYVDPAITRDPDTDRIHSITLSYTFYETPLPDGRQAQAAPAPRPPVN
ncbi:MAG: cytochrome c oxidase assembly protein [Paenirhodobacter sp.]|uniref:cytochrome c oxidase assembly protein n=1 Tax=Paenirhodobacter sp. TaxID=1965326 RepID=UPI003D124CC7